MTAVGSGAVAGIGSHVVDALLALATGHPMLREQLGTRYQFAAPFIVDDERFRRELRGFTPTPLARTGAPRLRAAAAVLRRYPDDIIAPGVPRFLLG